MYKRQLGLHGLKAHENARSGRHTDRFLQIFPKACHGLRLSLIHIFRGNESRSFPQTSFTLYSRKRYEKESFDPVLFDTGISDDSLILNNSKTLKKVFFFSLVEDREAAVQEYIPCQVFLNGEYWGMYYLMERYSSEYLEGRYDASPEESTLIKDTRYVADGVEAEIES